MTKILFTVLTIAALLGLALLIAAVIPDHATLGGCWDSMVQHRHGCRVAPVWGWNED